MNAVRHIFEDPFLRVEHFCKPHDRVMMVCQLYDSNSANATLIGIEYIITQEQYDSLPDREKPYWHAHREEFAPNRADPMMPELSPEQAQAEMAKMFPTWGKVIITWIPSDDLPSFPPQVQLVDHPFMVNATISRATQPHKQQQHRLIRKTPKVPSHSFFLLKIEFNTVVLKQEKMEPGGS